MNDNAKSKPDSLPVAKVQPSRSWTWVWLVPIFAFMFAGFLFFTHVVEKGPVLTIQFPQGHGVKPDDALRCRGIQIGFVESAVLDEDLEGVTVKVRLEHSAKSVGRAGSRFWIVRPRVDLTGVSGLETVAGPRYIAVLPGDGAKQREFVGLEQAPVVSMVEPDGLEVTLYAEQRGSVVPGAPILYRQIPVGNVLSVGLASDASGVEIRAYIRPMYRRIVCEKTVFWNVSGADLKVGWSGLRVELDSLQ